MHRMICRKEIGMKKHPCFYKCMANSACRIHLPIAPKCNLECIYCEKGKDCVNENLPGISSKIMNPHDAVKFFEDLYYTSGDVAVAGVAGPGDPLANFEEVKTTLSQIHRKFPKCNLCIATNGIEFEKYCEEIMSIGIKFVTITINALSVENAKKIYNKVYTERGVLEGEESALYVIEKQRKAMECIKKFRKYFFIKINTVYLKGINEIEIDNIVELGKKYNIDILNLMPQIKVKDEKIYIENDIKDKIMKLKEKYRGTINMMDHCMHCRADSVGVLNER